MMHYLPQINFWNNQYYPNAPLADYDLHQNIPQDTNYEKMKDSA
jgi:hypothetical protein